MEFHYGKHHAGYVAKLNAAAEKDASLAQTSLDDLVLKASGVTFNLAAQIWNHTFYWNCLSPNGGGEPKGKIAELINRDFGSFAAFKTQFSDVAGGHFGSGWAWLVQNESDKLEVVGTHDAANPLRGTLHIIPHRPLLSSPPLLTTSIDGKKPLLTCDVWEHAYYIDYRSNRPDYINGALASSSPFPHSFSL